jgi:PDZ domain
VGVREVLAVPFANRAAPMSATVIALVALSGCVSTWATYYRPNPNDIPPVQQNYGAPSVYYTSDMRGDLQRFWADGYVTIGVSAFDAAQASRSGAMAQGKRLHAAVVLISQEYTNTAQGTYVWTAPPKTTVSDESGTVSSDGDTVSYTSTTSSTTTGNSTVVPYQYNRYNFTGVFLSKVDFVLGITSEVAQGELATGPYVGLRITRVFPGTPAEDAGLHANDVLVSMNEKPTTDPARLVLDLQELAGTTVVFDVVRGPGQLKIAVELSD